jgi:hypothetical protein|tara:strand:+ start:286 stop:711 length:426 start_codon:yes stop_codon:yes gene_type:complete
MSTTVHQTKENKMSNKVNNTNGITKEFNKSSGINSRVYRSQLQFHLQRLIDNIDYNSQTKRDLMEKNQAWARDHQLEHKEKGTMLDNDEILNRNRVNTWKEEEIEVNNDIRAVVLEAFEQLFPEDFNKSNSVADALAKLTA